MPAEKLRTFFKFLVQKKPDETDFSKIINEKVLKAKITEDARRTFMTLEQEIRLAAKHAAQAAAQEAYEKASKEGYEKGYKEAEKEKEIALKEAAIEGKLESARNFKKSGVSAEIISKCTGLSLQQVQEL